MTRWRRLYHLRQWGPAVDEGIEWELRHHLEERVDELRAGGMGEADAAAQARRELGDEARLRAELRRIDRGRAVTRRLAESWLTLLQDIRYGARGLRRNAAFSVAVIVTLALGLGANGALFSVADALLLRPLPFAQPHELADVFQATPQSPSGVPYLRMAVAREWLEQQDAVSSAFLHVRPSATYTGGAEPVSLPGAAVTAGFGATLGVQPAHGRAFDAGDMAPGAPPVVLVSWDFWRRALGGSPSVVGTSVELNEVAHTVIGVMPRGFKYPTYSTTDFWVPISDDDRALGRTMPSAALVVRVAGGGFAAAEARASALASAIIRQTSPESEAFWRLRPVDERRSVASLKEAMTLLAGAAALILLIAGVNMVNLLLLRGAARTREIAVRLALGASRWRLVRQLGTEAMLLALLGGVIATAVAFGALRAVQQLMPSSITFFAPHAIELESRTLLFTFVLAVISGLVFGLLPAFRATRLAAAAAGGGLSPHVAAAPGGSPALRRSLVITEVALSVTLLVGAGLLMSSFIRLTRVDPGLDAQRLAALTMTVSSRDFPEPESRAAYLRLVEERVRAIPGVEATALTNGLPPEGALIMFGVAFQAEGGEPLPYEPPVPVISVGPDFFDVTGARLLDGRPFHSGDGPESNTVIINERLARHLWPGQNAVGRRFRVRDTDPWLTVVGVSDDIRLTGLDARYGDYELLQPLGAYENAGRAVLAIRTSAEPRLLLQDVRAAVHAVNPRQVIESVAPLAAQFAESIDMQRFLYFVVAALALLALALSSVGIYGLLAYGVARRHREIGVRMALGATAARVRALVLGEALVLTAVGAAAGAAGAIALSRFIEGVLFGVAPRDPATFAAVMLVILGAAVVAALLPAHRAVRVDPAVVLRAD